MFYSAKGKDVAIAPNVVIRMRTSCGGSKNLRKESPPEKTDASNHDESLLENREGHADLGGEAAGVVRGVGRSVLRAPIGRLPKMSRGGSGILRQRVPIKTVARVSDRISTSYDWYTSAVDSNVDGRKNNNWKQTICVVRPLGHKNDVVL